ncbi:MAG: aldo/keto reductase, partial [Hyphomicrobiaceae bacterium]
KRKLGRTGLEVTALGMGGAPLGDIYDSLDDDVAIATVEAAVECGVTLFDAAPLYGQGMAEHRYGTGLRRHLPDDLVLSTKVGRLLVPAPQGRTKRTRFVGGLQFDVVDDYSYDGAMRSYEQSIVRFGLPRIDILLIHDADPWGHGPVEGPKRYREAMEGAYRALDRLRSEGLIKGIGFGTNDPVYAANFLRDGDFDCFLLAGRYSLLEQPGLTEVLPLASSKNVGVMLGGVFNSGILATGPIEGARYNYTPAPTDILDKVRKIEAVCQRHATPLATAAVQFCIGHPQVSSVVLGGVRPAEVQQNVSAITADVPVDLWSELKAEGLLTADAPVPSGKTA